MKNALTMTEAARALGITRVTLGRLVRDGRLTTRENPLDKRQRLIPVEEIERLQGVNSGEPRPLPRTVGAIHDPELFSEQVKEYIKAHRKMG
jgi:excisionase family DNA binding protein